MSLFPLRRVLFASLVVALGTFTATAADEKENWYLAIGHGGQRMLSRDGKTWEKHVSWGEPKHDQNDLNVAVNFKGTFFAGGGFFSGRFTGTRDGERWSDGVIPGSSPIFGLQIVGDTLYAIDLRGLVFKSSDGEQWELVVKPEMPSKVHWIRTVAQGNGVIVGTGDYGPATVFDPATGKIQVTQMDGQTEKKATRVAFGNGVFVIVGQNGLITVSKDGKTWENNKAEPERGDFQGITFTGKEFVATGKKGMQRSADGLKWEPIKEKIPTNIRLVNGWLYGFSWPPSKISRSKDGVTWDPIPNEKNWQGINYAYGPLAGGEPPNPPTKKGTKPKK
jgi:hypothetical protein